MGCNFIGWIGAGGLRLPCIPPPNPPPDPPRELLLSQVHPIDMVDDCDKDREGALRNFNGVPLVSHSCLKVGLEELGSEKKSKVVH